MQTLKLFLISIVTLFFISCADKDKVLYTYDIDSKTHDTINVTNEHGKQGRWVIVNECSESVARPKRNIQNSTVAANTQTVGQLYLPMPILKEIGNYVDDKKQGLWTYYDPYGDINKTQEFKDDMPVGI